MSLRRIVLTSGLVVLAILLLLAYHPTVAAPLTAPDLVVDTLVFDPPQPASGQAVNITVTVKNQGDASASGIRVHLYIDPLQSPPTITTPYSSTTFYGVTLPPGGQFTWIRTNQTLASGLHSLYAWVDRDNLIAESNEANNLTGPITITVGNSADAY